MAEYTPPLPSILIFRRCRAQDIWHRGTWVRPEPNCISVRTCLPKSLCLLANRTKYHIRRSGTAAYRGLVPLTEGSASR